MSTDKEKNREQYKRWYEANREKKAAQGKKWQEANRERYLAQMKKRKQAYRAKRRAERKAVSESAGEKPTEEATHQLERSKNVKIHEDKGSKKVETEPKRCDGKKQATSARASSRLKSSQARSIQDQAVKHELPPSPSPASQETQATVVYLDPVVFSLKVHKKSFAQRNTIEFSLITQEYNFVGAEQGCTSCPSQQAIISSGKYPPTALHDGDKGPRICASCHELMFLRHCGDLWKSQGSRKKPSIAPPSVPRIVEEFVV